MWRGGGAGRRAPTTLVRRDAVATCGANLTSLTTPPKEKTHPAPHPAPPRPGRPAKLSLFDSYFTPILHLFYTHTLGRQRHSGRPMATPRARAAEPASGPAVRGAGPGRRNGRKGAASARCRN